jgi:hypothetical protein
MKHDGLVPHGKTPLVFAVDVQCTRGRVVATVSRNVSVIIGPLPMSVMGSKVIVISEYRRPFGVANPVPRSNGHGRRPAPESPPGAARKRQGVRFPDRTPYSFTLSWDVNLAESSHGGGTLLACLTKRPALVHRPSHSLSFRNFHPRGKIGRPASPSTDPRGWEGLQSPPAWRPLSTSEIAVGRPARRHRPSRCFARGISNPKSRVL